MQEVGRSWSRQFTTNPVFVPGGTRTSLAGRLQNQSEWRGATGLEPAASGSIPAPRRCSPETAFEAFGRIKREVGIRSVIPKRRELRTGSGRDVRFSLLTNP